MLPVQQLVLIVLQELIVLPVQKLVLHVLQVKGVHQEQQFVLLIVQPDILQVQLYSNVMHLLELQENQILQQEQLQKKEIVLNVQQELGVQEMKLNAQIPHA